MNTVVIAALGLVFILLVLAFKWKWRGIKPVSAQVSQLKPFLEQYTSCQSVQLVHRLCPHSNVVQRVPVEEKDSLDEHLDVLTRKLAEKEGRLRLSKSRIRQTQNEIENLHAIDNAVRSKYQDMMESLRQDLTSNEHECKKLQDQIEWVSRRRAELKDEISRGQEMYGKAAAELASNLAELQRGRLGETYKVTDKPTFQMHTTNTLRARKEPQLPHPTCCDKYQSKHVTSSEMY